MKNYFIFKIDRLKYYSILNFDFVFVHKIKPLKIFYEEVKYKIFTPICI